MDALLVGSGGAEGVGGITVAIFVGRGGGGGAEGAGANDVFGAVICGRAGAGGALMPGKGGRICEELEPVSDTAPLSDLLLLISARNGRPPVGGAGGAGGADDTGGAGGAGGAEDNDGASCVGRGGALEYGIGGALEGGTGGTFVDAMPDFFL